MPLVRRRNPPAQLTHCARKGQSCTYDRRNDTRTAIHRADARVHPGGAPEGGETGNYASWLPDMSAADRPRDVEGSITTPSVDITQPANTSYDGVVDAAVNSSGTYNNSELNRLSRWSQQDPAFDFMFDPFIFWSSQETAGLLDNPLPNDSAEVAAHTTDKQYYHVPPISEGAYNNIYTFHLQHPHPSQLQAFPDAEILNTFMQMYFEFCREELPLFHLPTFAPSPESWIVVAAIVAVGCNYSVSRYREEVSETMLMLHRVMPQKITDNSLLNGDLPLAQGIFLLNLCQMFHGTREEFLKLQYQRNILTTLCRLHMAQTSSIFNARSGLDDDSCRDTWKAWVKQESWRRLVYSTWSE
ncbi:hypothetical protein OAory_01052900 [Aspergillus oryzae]|uniref:Xylanolytic transcriptional activator regulatory domain-containing protein n=1 Tax=Aspergillus oryzae TaxID=5062 RepID=A0A1S9D5R3_ASPOZ|nr:hypothetical protein OAory_01052900 [Aspergillus oryzae]